MLFNAIVIPTLLALLDMSPAEMFFAFAAARQIVAFTLDAFALITYCAFDELFFATFTKSVLRYAHCFATSQRCLRK